MKKKKQKCGAKPLYGEKTVMLSQRVPGSHLKDLKAILRKELKKDKYQTPKE
jgi:hypothetical protein